MDYYLIIIIALLGLIGWTIFIKWITFKTKFIYLLFFFAYIFSILPVILVGINYYYSGLFQIFINYIMADFWNIIFLNYTLLTYFFILGVGLILLRIMSYSIDRFQKRVPTHEITKIKKSKINKEDKLFKFGLLIASLYDLKVLKFEEEDKDEK